MIEIHEQRNRRVALRRQSSLLELPQNRSRNICHYQREILFARQKFHFAQAKYRRRIQTRNAAKIENGEPQRRQRRVFRSRANFVQKMIRRPKKNESLQSQDKNSTALLLQIS